MAPHREIQITQGSTCTAIGQNEHAPELINPAHFSRVMASFLCQEAILNVRKYLRSVCEFLFLKKFKSLNDSRGPKAYSQLLMKPNLHLCKEDWENLRYRRKEHLRGSKRCNMYRVSERTCKIWSRNQRKPSRVIMGQDWNPLCNC